MACGAVQRPDGGRGLLGAGSSVGRLEGRDQHGEVVTLSFPTSQPTVVYFYPKDSTPGCTEEACAFRNVWAKYQTRGITVIGVSSDDVASHLAFAQEHQLPFPLVADESGEWGLAFGVPNLAGFYSRVTFLVGRDGRVLKTYEAVDPGLHANQILDDADQLAPAKPATEPPFGNDALLAPAPRSAPEPAPTVLLKLHLGVSPEERPPTGMWLAAELTPPPGAHLSWKHVGESGLPTVLEVFAPPGFHVGQPLYPAPTRYRTAAARTALGYTGPVVVLVPVTPAPDAPTPDMNRPETYAAFRAQGTWLSCDTRCIKEDVTQTLNWNGSKVALPRLPEWWSALPETQIPTEFSARLRHQDNAIELSCPTAWQLEDAFGEADVAPGGRLAALARDAAGRYLLSPVSTPPPAHVIVRARTADTTSRHFRVSVTDE